MGGATIHLILDSILGGGDSTIAENRSILLLFHSLSRVLPADSTPSDLMVVIL